MSICVNGINVLNYLLGSNTVYHLSISLLREKSQMQLPIADLKLIGSICLSRSQIHFQGFILMCANPLSPNRRFM